MSVSDEEVEAVKVDLSALAILVDRQLLHTILSAAAKVRANSEGAYIPQAVHYDNPEAADPYWEFIAADAPNVAGPMQAANVEFLTAIDDRSKVVGIRVYVRALSAQEVK